MCTNVTHCRMFYCEDRQFGVIGCMCIKFATLILTNVICSCFISCLVISTHAPMLFDAVLVTEFTVDSWPKQQQIVKNCKAVNIASPQRSMWFRQLRIPFCVSTKKM